MTSEQKFINAYLEAALWSSTNDAGNFLDNNYDADDIDAETRRKMEDDCRQFIMANAADIEHYYDQAGHDFWLTRNGRGAGFWDGDWPQEIGQRLTEASKKFKECALYVGDDGKIHGSPG